jgi:hypothetical protein
MALIKIRDQDDLPLRTISICDEDFIANAGGVICTALEYRGASRTEVFAAIAEKVC